MSAGAAQRAVSMDNEYYMPIGDCSAKIFAKNATTGALTGATWASGAYANNVNASGAGLLKDIGRTYISGGRTFRRVQLVIPQGTKLTSTFGVAGATGTAPLSDFLTGFIEVGFDATAGTTPTPVVKWGR
jgi:hypothetical protein